MRPAQVRGLDIRVTGDGATVTAADGARHYLNSSAAAILLMCDGRPADSDIDSELQRAFALDAEPLEDVRRTLADLQEKGLVQASSAP